MWIACKLKTKSRSSDNIQSANRRAICLGAIASELGATVHGEQHEKDGEVGTGENSIRTWITPMP